MGKCTIIIGDALACLQKLPNACIDLTITDPPYTSLDRHRAVGTTTRLKQSAASNNPWFETIPNRELRLVLLELYRVQKKDTHLRVFCDEETAFVAQTGINPFIPSKGNDTPTGWRLLWTSWPSWTWFKTKCSLEDSPTCEAAPEEDDYQTGMGYHGRRCSERILFLEKGHRKLLDLAQRDVVFGPRAKKGDFPTQKPLSAIRPLILGSSKEGDLVLDCFAGSGGVAIVALSLGRNALLVEKNPSPWLYDTAKVLGAEHTVEWKLSP